jgi:Effector Associated Constant Component 1
MPDNGGERPLALLLALEPGQDADDDEAERLGRQLGAELRELDVDSVQPAAERPAPDGAKGVAVSLAELLVTMSGTGGVLATVVATIRDWLGRRRDAGRVVLTIDGDTLELSSATTAERTELVDAFVRRHSGV